MSITAKIFVDTQVDMLSVEQRLTQLPQWFRATLEGCSRAVMQQKIAAFFLLGRALHQEFGLNQVPQWKLQDGGKPYFSTHPDVHFNLSHTHGVVACGVDSRPVGIDVERMRKYSEPLAQRVLTAGELALLEASSDKAEAFIRFWTRKEALLKLTGEGIRRQLSTVDTLNQAVEFHSEVHQQPCFVLTVCQ